MSKRKPYKPQPFESKGGNNLSANIYATMLQSPAYLTLSGGAVKLYNYMKLQLYGAKNIPEHPSTDFVFNWAMASKTYPIYTNKKQFYKDRDMLIEHGLIEYVENGKNTRTKSIYRFSDKWQVYLAVTDL